MFLFNVHEIFPQEINDYLAAFSEVANITPKSMGTYHCTEITAVTSRPEELGSIIYGSERYGISPCPQPNLEFRVVDTTIWDDQLVVLFEKTRAHTKYHAEILARARCHVQTIVPNLRHTDKPHEMACHPTFKNALNPLTFRSDEYIDYRQHTTVRKTEEINNEITCEMFYIDPKTEIETPALGPQHFGFDNYSGIPFIGRKRIIHTTLGRITGDLPDTHELIGLTFPVTQLGVVYEEKSV